MCALATLTNPYHVRYSTLSATGDVVQIVHCSYVEAFADTCFFRSIYNSVCGGIDEDWKKLNTQHFQTHLKTLTCFITFSYLVAVTFG